MGHLYREYVIAQIWRPWSRERKNSKDKSMIKLQKTIDALDKLCKKSDGMIVEVTGKANGETNYFMAWDGSKEGWKTSEHFDKLRERFLKICKANDWVRWYYIRDDENDGNVILESYTSKTPVVQKGDED